MFVLLAVCDVEFVRLALSCCVWRCLIVWLCLTVFVGLSVCRRTETGCSVSFAVVSTKDPWLLRCLHTFCQACFDARVEQEGKNECPVCQERDVFGHLKLRPDYAARYALEHGAAERRPVPCSGGPAGAECGRPAVSHCPTCAKYMCTGCHTAHLELSRSHRVQSLGEARADGKRAVCWLHPSQSLQQYCATCEVPMCQLCADAHPSRSPQAPAGRRGF